ncbi:MAG: cysteine--tRNA ligase [Candidatus Hodarchaeota archaeon]
MKRFAMNIYNTLEKKKVEFQPAAPPIVMMYVCGPTVYDSPHVGHARSAVAFDIFRRYLEYKNFDVIFTRNYTDIDDKMITRANEQGITIKELAKKYIDEYEVAMDLLNVKPPVFAPRATYLIDDFIKYIQVLEEKGFAYEKNGNVYFRVWKFEEYGKLSKRPKKEIEDTLRRDSEEFVDEKEDPRDFALWKSKKQNEPSWKSPWGEGRPGWHIECSVMSTKFMGKSIDVHGGGQDLVFPHHENEIAQSEAYSGEQFCKYWIHNGFVTVDKEKMSKSLGNFFTVQQVLKEQEPPALRMFLISAQYRNPINFSKELLEQSRKNWIKVRDTWFSLERIMLENDVDVNTQYIKPETLQGNLNDILIEFESAMDDDLNTPKGIAAMFALIKLVGEDIEKGVDITILQQEYRIFQEILNVLGFTRQYVLRFGTKVGKSGDTLDALIKYVVDTRDEERIKKNFQKSDEIRDFLNSIGVEISDGPEGTTWKLRE